MLLSLLNNTILGSLLTVNVIDLGYLNITANSDPFIIPDGTTVNIYDSGWTNLSGSHLVVDGTLRGMTLNIKGGTLSGVGTIDMWGGVANSGGTVMPGSATQPGQLTISGDYTQQGKGALLIVMDPTGASKLIVSGDAILSGRLKGQGINGYLPPVGTQYTVVSADSVSGQFSGAAFISPLLFFKPMYTSTEVMVTVERDYLNPALLSNLSSNQIIMLKEFNRFASETANDDLQTVIKHFDELPNTTEIKFALDSAEPIGGDVLLNMAVDNLTFATLFEDPSCQIGKVNLLLNGMGYAGTAYDSQGKNPYGLRSLSGAFGIDYVWSRQITGGVFWLLNHATAGLYTGSTVSDNFNILAPFIQVQHGSWLLSGMAGYGWHNIDLNRHITIGSLYREAHSHPGASEFLAEMKGGYSFVKNEKWHWLPTLSLQFVNLAINDYKESGAGSLALAVQNQLESSLRAGVGAELSYANNEAAVPFLKANYFHEFLSPPSITAKFIGVANSSFTLSAPAAQRNFVLLDAGLRLGNCKPWQLRLAYDGLLQSSHVTNAFTLQASLQV